MHSNNGGPAISDIDFIKWQILKGIFSKAWISILMEPTLLSRVYLLIQELEYKWSFALK